MTFENCNSILYSDTLIPDIFIAEYLPSAEGDYVKVYLYCKFLVKYGKSFSVDALSKKLELQPERVKDALVYWESLGVLARNDSGYVFADLKEKEIRRHYRLKTTSSPEEAVFSSERNKKRSQIVNAINNAFFQGVMPPSWYTDIDAWFDRYHFEEDVMYALFKHCYDYKGLSKNYIVKVADNWHSKGIRNSVDLETYYVEYEKFKNIRNTICKKLKLARNLTEYEEEYIEKWVVEYKYSFDVIEYALRKTTSQTKPNFKYLHTIITDWYNKGLRSVKEITACEEEGKKTSKSKAKSDVPKYKNIESHQYGSDYLDKLIDNIAT